MEYCSDTEAGLQEQKLGRANLARNSLGQSHHEGKDRNGQELLNMAMGLENKLKDKRILILKSQVRQIQNTAFYLPVLS